MFGTLSEGSCGRDAIAPLDNPNTYAVGIDCNDDYPAQVRSDGTMVYLGYELEGSFDSRLRVFTPDAHPWENPDPEVDNPLTECTYPDDPRANDSTLPHLCLADDSINRFALQVGTQHYAYGCAGAGTTTWYTDDGTELPFPASMTVVAWSGDGAALLRDNFDIYVATMPDGTPQVLDFGDTFQASLLVAARDEGFFVAKLGGPSAAEPNRLTLYDVDAAGTITEVGDYEYSPDVRTYKVLTSDGTLYAEGSDPSDTLLDTVIRYTVGAPPEIAYTEATDPYVKLHISTIFSDGAPSNF